MAADSNMGKHRRERMIDLAEPGSPCIEQPLSAGAQRCERYREMPLPARWKRRYLDSPVTAPARGQTVHTSARGVARRRVGRRMKSMVDQRSRTLDLLSTAASSRCAQARVPRRRLALLPRQQDITGEVRLRACMALLLGLVAVASRFGLETILGAFLTGAVRGVKVGCAGV